MIDKSKFKGLWIPYDLILLDITWTKKILLSEISQLEMLDAGCVASNAHFSEKLNMSKQGVSKALNELHKEEYIIIDNAQTKRNFGRKITINHRKSAINCGKSAINHSGETIDSKPIKSSSSISSKVITLTKVELMEGWNKYAKDIGIASVYEITDERYRKFTTRCNRYTDFVDRLIECLVIASENDYLKKASWFTLDWIIANDTNHIKVLEGKYK